MKHFNGKAVMVGAALFMIACASPALAAVETQTVSTIKAAGEALDTTVSADGKFFYVLTGKGTIDVFPTAGGAKEEITIEGKADKIAVSQNGDTLFLTDSHTGETRMVSVDFIQQFETAGSPFKGPENAPVTIVLFSDFQ